MDDINYIPNYLEESKAHTLYRHLEISINWQNILHSQTSKSPVKIKRHMAYVSDDSRDYLYSTLLLKGESWTGMLCDIRDELNKALGLNFNSVLLNKYNDGKDEIRWHSDKETQLGKQPIIACLNLGATRNMWFLDKASGVKTPYPLSNGDLLIMGENCQDNKLHAILKEKDVTGTRISLTFRNVKV